MKQKHRAERVKTTPNFLVVYVRIDAGLTVRWIAVQVPWAMLADHHRAIVENLERVYVAQLEADADVQYLPLEKWE